MSTRLHIVVPDELVGRIDAERGLVPRSRWIVALIENALVAAPLVPPRERSTGAALEPPAKTEPEIERPKPRVPPPAQGWTAPKRS